MARLRYRMLRNRRHVVGIRQPLGLVREERTELDLVEAGEREVEAELLQVAEFEPQPRPPLAGLCRPRLWSPRRGDGGHPRAPLRTRARNAIDLSWLTPTQPRNAIDLSWLTPTQRQAYVIADNQLATDAGWDAEMLRPARSSVPPEGAHGRQLCRSRHPAGWGS
jgi:hypothetical protein